MELIKIKERDFKNNKRNWFIELPNNIIVSIGKGVKGYEKICPLTLKLKVKIGWLK